MTFTPSVSEWINKTNAIGLYVKRGKYGGTYAHKDLAFEFAAAISPVFKLYLIKEFQRLKEEENNSRQIEWNAKRFLSKSNYLIQTDAVKNYLLPQINYRENLQWLAYAEEADILNVALFGFTAKAWREANPELAKKSNVRDFATINELTVLSNLESHNAQMIKERKGKEERFKSLQEIAEYQLNVLNTAEQIKKLFYGKVGALEVTVTSEQKGQRENTVLLDKWKLSFWKGNSLTVEKMIPEVMMNYFEIELLLSGEIYGIVQKFMEELYHSGRIQDFSFIS